MHNLTVTWFTRDSEHVPGGAAANEQVSEMFRAAISKAARDFYDEHQRFFGCPPDTV